MSLVVRPARPDEVRQLAALSIQVWLDTYSLEGMREALADYVLDRFTPAYFVAMLAAAGKTVFVAERNNHMLGYAVYGHDTVCPKPVEDGSIELETLYVARHFHRQGVGRALLKAAPSDQPLWLTTWHGNTPALEFYRLQGFVDIGATFFDLEGEQHENRILLRPVQIEAMA
jgi:ribosomal protein S18 acetylase RimI-like enzyme